ncbi:MAG: hypothetical protein KME21_02740 [Desmonostoc vinosum HA7617-LM4]|nr:hypothetical protein [Desmonostoc vinosum HA7617-LM4]
MLEGSVVGYVAGDWGLGTGDWGLGTGYSPRPRVPASPSSLHSALPCTNSSA